jgi:hypothetical protein
VKVSEADFRRRWCERYAKEHPGAWIYKIPDSPYGGYRPFDTVIVDGGQAIAVEFKVHRRTRPFDLERDVRPHQLDELRRFRAAGGRAIVVALVEASGEELVLEP